MKLKKNQIILISIITVVVCLIGFTIVGNMAKDKKVVEETAVPVIVNKPEIGEINKILHYSGNLKPKNQIMIVPKVSGRIEKIFVKKGDMVLKDQILVQIESQIVSFQKEQAYSMWQAADAQFERAKKGVRKQELENAQASLSQAEQDLSFAEENFKRTERLYQSGTVAKSKYEEAQNALNSARTTLENAKRSIKLMEEGASDEEIKIALANADSAKAQYEMAKLQVGFTKIDTPVYGIVAAILVDEGNMVGSSTPILAIVQVDPVIADIPVPEEHYGEIKQKIKSIRVRILPNAYPDSNAFIGKITNIAPTIDPMSRTFNVEVEIDNPYQLLRPGMYVNVELQTDLKKNVLLLPKSAVVKRDGQEVVFLAVNDRSFSAKQVPVKTGLSSAEKIEILSGLDKESTVIIQGNNFLENNQIVRIIETL